MADHRPLTVRRHGSRGAAAFEFALVAPIMIALFGALVSFGLIVWSQYQLGLLSQAAARNCVAMQQSLAGNATSSLQACATQQFNMLYSQMNSKLCDGTPTLSPSTMPLGTPLRSGRQAYLLRVQVSCQKNYLPFINALPSSKLTSIRIGAQSAMPFLP